MSDFADQDPQAETPADQDPQLEGTSSLDTPIEWGDYPELVRATTYGADIDAYLVDIGIDTSVISDSGNV